MDIDQILVNKLKEKDEEAYKQLVDLYQNMVYNTCLGFVRHEEDADDLTQDVFIEVFRSIHNFRQEAKISTWIYRIAVSKSLEYLRSKKRKKRFAILRSVFYSGEDLSTEIPDYEHPGVVAENKERSKILFLAIDKLPESQKTAYTLHKLEGLSYEKIADIMGKSVSSVESILHRAKSNLKKYLYDYYYS